MKKMMLIVMMAVLLGGWNSTVMAHDKGVNGLIFGAGSGALIGQAIGRNTEATLIGTAVGGMMGYIIGNEREHRAYRAVPAVVVHDRHWSRSPRRPPVVFYRVLPPPVVQHRHHYYPRW